MHSKSSKYSPKYSGPKITHHLNLRPSYNSTIADWSRIGNLMTKPWLFYVLDQFATHGLQYGQNWKDDQFLGHCILVLETLSATCFIYLPVAKLGNSSGHFLILEIFVIFFTDQRIQVLFVVIILKNSDILR